MDEGGFFVDGEDVDGFFEDLAGDEVECEEEAVVCFITLKHSSLA